MFDEELKVFLIALMPLLETRASIPFGIFIANLPISEVLALSIVGNIAPAPFLLWGLSAFEKWVLSGYGGLRGVMRIIYQRLLIRVRLKGMKYIRKYGLLGLTIFVAIPLPGSGVWTGCLVSHVMGLEPWKSIIAIGVGSLIASLLILASALGVISLWS
ncbi:MAG: small multi-drug export protein [Candidatus Nezhaarchaeota archaeon]|nr:small multi-drug export protein [Candidatus Nezhaarchaeota archaeon]MCX8141443.1 small multi-drug export protein [Candidatus Nezhaarchaeota archaeon]MDW8049709.1 small multi-drug export protein [Nitrososphaerota archaeon]